MQQYNGPIRRVDELGRVVIPKEIRNTLKISAGNMLEFCCDVNTNSIILSKHEPIKQIKDFAHSCLRTLGIYPEYEFVLCDTTHVLFAQNNTAKEYVHSTMHSSLFNKLKGERELHNTIVFENDIMQSNNVVLPILCRGDLWGCIVILYKGQIAKPIIDAVRIICSIVGNYITE